MATQNLYNFDAILKNVYRGPIVEQLNQESYGIDQFERQAANDMGAFAGKSVLFPIHTARNRGRSSLADGGNLPTAGNQSYKDGIVTMRYFAQGIELSDQVIKQSETNEGAFVRALTAEIEGATTDLRKDINRQIYGTGDGVLANVAGTVASGTITSVTVDSVQYIAVGDSVDLVKSDGTILGTAAYVTAVTNSGTAGGSTQANGTITIQTSATNTAGVSIASALTSGFIALSGCYNQESDGLRNITATSGTLHALSASTTPVWAGSELDSAYASYSAGSNGLEDLFIQLSQTIRKKSSKTPDVFLTTLGVQRRLANTYTSLKRYNDAKVVDVSGGYSAIMVAAGNNPIPVVSDVDAPLGFAFGLKKDVFAWCELSKPDWLTAPDGKGSIMTLKTGSAAGSRQAIWQAWLGWNAALVCTARNQTGRIKGLQDDLPVARV
jgi:hypothetical protein